MTPADAPEVRHLVLSDFDRPTAYVEGESLGVVVPGEPRPGGGERVRYYSIASSRMGDDGRGDSLSLCVKRSATVPGVAGPSGSHYVCDLAPGASVRLVGPFGPTFPLPEEARAPLLLVATGTGVASFRGLARRMLVDLPSWPGVVRLDQGARTRAEAVYAEEFRALAERPGFVYHLSLSGGHESRRVDHALEADAPLLWRWLHDESGRLYVCGVRGMEERVEAVFAEQARRAGVDWLEFRQRLVAEGRLRVSTY